MSEKQANNPLHGKTLEHILNDLVEYYGWNALGEHVDIRCFTSDPSVKSSLKFLRKAPWARKKVEDLYIAMLSKRVEKKKISIGQIYELEVVKAVEFGFYLDAEDLGEVLLPNKNAPEDLVVGDTVEVFLYLDSEGRPVATNQAPKAVVGEFAYLKVVDTSAVGAFLDWGLDKDVLVPFAEQHRPMEVGHSYLVYIFIGLDGRIIASSKIDKFLDDEKPHNFKPQQAVDLIIANSTDLGYKAIVNHSHWGVLYKNDVFQRLSFGQYKKGFIKHIRPDGKIDLSLQGGQETRDKYAKIILNHLRKQGGFAPVNDKSDPQLISDLFGMSKGAFKKAIGGLYKQRIISIEKDGIRLIEK